MPPENAAFENAVKFVFALQLIYPQAWTISCKMPIIFKTMMNAPQTVLNAIGIAFVMMLSKHQYFATCQDLPEVSSKTVVKKLCRIFSNHFFRFLCDL